MAPSWQLLVFVAAVAAGLLVGGSRKVLWFQIVSFALVATLNLENADFENYRLTYEAIDRGTSVYSVYFELYEPGYRFLARAADAGRYSFEAFRGGLICLSLLVMFYAIRDLPHCSRAFSGYLLFPGLLDVVQLRNLAAGALVTLSYSLALRSFREGKNSYRAVVAALGATGFQAVAWVYAIAVIGVTAARRSLLLSLAGALLLAVGFESFVSQLSLPVLIARFSEYAGTQTSILTRIGSEVVLVLSAVLLLRASERDRWPWPSRYLFIIPMAACALLVPFNVEFLRIFRNLVLVLGSLLFSSTPRGWLMFFVAVLPLAYLFNIVAGFELVTKAVLSL